MGKGTAPGSLAERRAVLVAAAEVLRGLDASLWEAQGHELGELMGELDTVAALASAGRVSVTGEAVSRGEVASSRCAGTTGWVLANAPTLRQGGAAVVARCVEAFTKPENAPVRDAVLAARVAPGVGWAVVGQMERLRGRITEEADPTVTEAMLSMGEQHGSPGVRRVRPALLATYGLDGEFQDEQDSRARFVALSQPFEDDGVWHYRLSVDASGRAVLEASIGPLSAPRVDPATGLTRDTRSSDQRRGDALVEVCRRASAAGESVPTSVKACLFVTMPLADLQARTGAGSTVGASDSGALLAPETVRRMACDAGVIPVVLGGRGEVLELGRMRRLFTKGQTKALWLRDRGCTFPGCTAPGHWCDAHHVVFWADGGPTDLENAVLLCGRHHTVVHRDRLMAAITADGVEWDQRPSSYDRALEARAAIAGQRGAGVKSDPESASSPADPTAEPWQEWLDPQWEPGLEEPDHSGRDGPAELAEEMRKDDRTA